MFKDLGLFLLPKSNGQYYIIKGEGYVDVPLISTKPKIYNSKLDFQLDTSKIGNSEMQHLDFAYAASLIRTFMKDPTLVLTIRGRKFTPQFSFKVGSQLLEAHSVQTEVDAGYEGKNQVVLIEAKSSGTANTIIRQLYYPFRQWQEHTAKKVYLLFFEKNDIEDTYYIWQFKFVDPEDYNSIRLVRSKSFKII
ncbi:MAG: hypothetical protein A3J06_01300 [Candidatus Moranbacteria bacterium RIFCSPLOWO2_02_FULL_48_19]|nr:MAG: hypothetical protein A3J06_01300 [Candidatus Moranbacteria bacterium RIFCSPLOWO2_02_FULL_48_19]OGI31993.1 MAG: hypothetical protein A3G09_02920 [Candidatus Moranbacteria bacterium RIFCSPLOWO2_12_FULL_48_12]